VVKPCKTFEEGRKQTKNSKLVRKIWEEEVVLKLVELKIVQHHPKIEVISKQPGVAFYQGEVELKQH